MVANIEEADFLIELNPAADESLGVGVDLMLFIFFGGGNDLPKAELLCRHFVFYFLDEDFGGFGFLVIPFFVDEPQTVLYGLSDRYLSSS